jgi:hypothetical protein
MMPRSRAAVLVVLLSTVTARTASVTAAPSDDRLPSWNDGAAKKAIVGFVAKVTEQGSPDFVPLPNRIAVFDNDGTLWPEQPTYVQLFFAIDRVKSLAPQHPEWKDQQPFKAAIENDLKALSDAGEFGLLRLVMATHAGMTTDEFEASVKDWIATAKHPRFHRPFTELAFQPMLELLSYLRANGFKTYVVSGGDVDFMRPWTQKVYGVPPEQVLGSNFKLKYELRDGKPVLMRQPLMDFFNDRDGKAVQIHRVIGRRPIVAFGNSDGDFQMLEWTTAGVVPRLGVIIHHDDADREWAYDRTSRVGRLRRGLDEASKRGWTVVSMKNDWRRIFQDARQAKGPQ